MKKIIIVSLLAGTLVGCGTQSSSSQPQSSSQPSSAPTVQQNTDSQDLANYWSQIKDPYTSLESDVQTVSSLVEEDVNNPNEVYSQDYRDQVQQACSKMDSDISAIEAVPAPSNPKVASIQNEIIQGVDQLKFVADNLPTAVDNVDVNLVSECNQAYKNASVDFSTATTMEQQLQQGGN